MDELILPDKPEEAPGSDDQKNRELGVFYKGEISNALYVLDARMARAAETIRPPEQRLEELEIIVKDLLGLGGKIIGYSWFVIGQIVSEGLWRSAKDKNGQPYRQYWQYVADLWESCMQYVSVRTIFSRLSQIDLMRQLDVSMGAQVQILSDKPYLAAQALSVAEVDEATGDFIGLPTSARLAIKNELGLSDEESEKMDDASLMREFMQKLPELPHNDASEMVGHIKGTWKYLWRWLPREKILVVKGTTATTNDEDVPNRWSVRFKLLGGDVHHPNFKQWIARYMIR